MRKEWRVKSKQDFQFIISKKKSVSNKTYVLYYQPRKEDHARFGVSVGKKLGNAVFRNKWKRQLRMLLQETVHFDQCPVDGVIIVRKSFTTQSFQENKICLESLLNKVYNKDIEN